MAGSFQLLPQLHNIRVDEQGVQKGLLQTPEEDLLQGVPTNSATVSFEIIFQCLKFIVCNNNCCFLSDVCIGISINSEFVSIRIHFKNYVLC